MGILNRFVRIFKADIHGVMDQLEDKGLLLRQYLRDMEDALAQKEAWLGRVTAARDQARQESARHDREIDKLEQDLAVAIKKDKNDIARMLIKKILPLTKLRESLENHMDHLKQEIAGIKESIDQQRMQYEHLKQQARQYFHQAEQQAWEKSNTVFEADSITSMLGDDEIEIELLRRKEALA